MGIAPRLVASGYGSFLIMWSAVLLASTTVLCLVLLEDSWRGLNPSTAFHWKYNEKRVTPSLTQPGRDVFPTKYIPIYNDDDDAVSTMSFSIIHHRLRVIYILQEQTLPQCSNCSTNSTQANSIPCRRIDGDDGSNGSIASKFRVYLPPWHQKSLLNATSATYQLQTVSQQAIHHQCQYAINAGPFHSDGSPVGSLVVHPHQIIVADMDHNPNMIGFGLMEMSHGSNNRDNGKAIGATQHPTKQWVFGSLSGTNQLMPLQDFVTGFGWLVYEGRNVVPSDDKENDGGTGAIRAPRTAVGVTSRGQLLLVVADGCEHCFALRGPTLYELADVMVEHGAAFAINLDGGSSSVLVINGTVYSRPTCFDFDLECERPVSSIICLRR